MIILKKIKKQWKLYPIGSPKGALNNKREPEYVGTVKFMLPLTCHVLLPIMNPVSAVEWDSATPVRICSASYI